MVILSVCLMPSCGNLYLRIKPEERSRLVQTFKLTEVRFSISPANTLRGSGCTQMNLIVLCQKTLFPCMHANIMICF